VTLWAMWLPAIVSPMVGLVYASEGADLMFVLGGSLIVLGNIIGLAGPRDIPARPEGEGGGSVRRTD
jgi:hypothetical protein